MPPRTKAVAAPVTVKVEPSAEALAQAAALDKVTARYKALGPSPISVNTLYYRLGQAVAETGWIVPRFQRDHIWTMEQSLSFHRRIFVEGGSFGVVTLWRSYVDGKMRRYVLDGRQRLASVGVPLVDEDGSVLPAPPLPVWDIQELNWSADPGPRRFALKDLKMSSTSLKDLGEEGALSMAFAGDRVGLITIPFLEIDTSYDYTSFEDQRRRALTVFRDLNSGGTPIPQAVLDELISKHA